MCQMCSSLSKTCSNVFKLVQNCSKIISISSARGPTWQAVLDLVFHRSGLPGKNCLLRAVCEVAYLVKHQKNNIVVDQLLTREMDCLTTADQAVVNILIPGRGGRRVAKPGPGWQSPPGSSSHGARWARRRTGEGPFCLIISLISLSLAVIWGSNVDNLYLQVDYLAARTVGRRGNGECEQAYSCPGFFMIIFRFLHDPFSFSEVDISSFLIHLLNIFVTIQTIAPKHSRIVIFFGFLEKNICQHWLFLFVQLQQTHLPTWLRWWKISILSINISHVNSYKLWKICLFNVHSCQRWWRSKWQRPWYRHHEFETRHTFWIII